MSTLLTFRRRLVGPVRCMKGRCWRQIAYSWAAAFHCRRRQQRASLMRATWDSAIRPDWLSEGWRSSAAGRASAGLRQQVWQTAQSMTSAGGARVTVPDGTTTQQANDSINSTTASTGVTRGRGRTSPGETLHGVGDTRIK